MATKQPQISSYVLANRITRSEAEALRLDHPGAVVSRNTDGTYRVTRGR